MGKVIELHYDAIGNLALHANVVNMDELPASDDKNFIPKLTEALGFSKESIEEIRSLWKYSRTEEGDKIILVTCCPASY